MLDLRLVERLRRDCGGGTGWLCDWHRDLGINYLSVVVLRGERTATDLWAGQPAWGDGTELFDG